MSRVQRRVIHTKTYLVPGSSLVSVESSGGKVAVCQGVKMHCLLVNIFVVHATEEILLYVVWNHRPCVWTIRTYYVRVQHLLFVFICFFYFLEFFCLFQQ